MIVFDLACSRGHTFEGWFDSREDFESQLERRLVTCPVCGDESVRRVPSPFAIAKHGRGSRPSADQVPDHELAARLLGQALRRYLEENFEDVGPQFAKEALKIHYGVAEARNIRGVSTPEEEKMLREEGVSFFKIGAPVVPAPSSESEEED
jgi:hypothetical protein